MNLVGYIFHLVMATILLLPTDSVWASEVKFRLVVDSAMSIPHLEICGKLEAALATRRSFPPNLCVHEVPLPENDPDFQSVRWEELDPLRNMDLVIRLFWNYYDWKGDLSESERAAIWTRPIISRYRDDGVVEQRSPRDLIASGDVSLGRARFDINFDGKVDTVYRFGIGGCQSIRSGSAPALAGTLHVIDPDDPELIKGTRQQVRLGMGGAFAFKGRTYLVSNTGSIIVRETSAWGHHPAH